MKKLIRRFIDSQAARRKRIQERLTASHRKVAALGHLANLAAHIQAGHFTIKLAPLHLARRFPQLRHVRQYARLSMHERKQVERWLKAAYPALNRKERRHLRAKHRWMFLSHA